MRAASARCSAADASVPVAAQYPPHAITDGFGRVITAYPMARSMSPIEGGSNGHTAQPFVNTSAQSWAEADLASLSTRPSRTQRRQGRQAGPGHARRRVSIRAGHRRRAASGRERHARIAGPRRKPETRVVAVGDSDFASNCAIGISGNRDLFVNSLNWLSQQENLIAVRPREPEDRRLTLTADQQNRIMMLCRCSSFRASSSRPASTPGGGGGKGCAALTSTLVLVVVLAGLGGYIYFVDSKRPGRASMRGPSQGEGLHALEADKINEVSSLTRVNRSLLRKSDGGWKMVEPAQIDADPPEAIGVGRR